MATKIKVVEASGNAADVESTIQTTLNGLTIASGSEPSIAVTPGPRPKVFIIYRDA